MYFLTGALAACHDFVDPKPYYETCVYDLCAEKSSTNLCNNIKLYAEACYEAGGSVPSWYEDRLECKPGDNILLFNSLCSLI